MTPEQKLQNKILRWLKDRGFWAMKLKPGFGVPKGTSDIFFCKGSIYGWLEVKSSEDAEVQVGQTYFMNKMAKWTYARFVWPENWEEIREELKRFI